MFFFLREKRKVLLLTVQPGARNAFDALMNYQRERVRFLPNLVDSFVGM